MSQDTDNIEELFRSKLDNFELPVDASIWSSIESNIVSSKPINTSSIFSKAILAGSSALIIAAGVFVYYNYNTSLNGTQITVNNTIEVVNEDGNIKSDDVSDNTVNTLVDENSDLAIPRKVDNVNSLIKISNNVVPENDLVVDEFILPSISKPPVEAIPKIIKNETVQDVSRVVEHHIKSDVDMEILTAPMLVEKTDITYLPNIYVLSNPEAFKIKYTGDFKDFSISILDSKQNTVFRSNTPDFKWIGENLYGEKVQPGDYLYLIIGVDKDNNKVQKHQSLRIIP